MKLIHKVAAVSIKDDKFLMVRKKGKDIWTSLGGHIEDGETEEQALRREIKEELDCDCVINYKIGDFEANAVFDDAILRLSTYLVELKGEPKITDDELDEFQFIPSNYKKLNINLPESIEQKVIPFCINNGLLDWKQ